MAQRLETVGEDLDSRIGKNQQSNPGEASICEFGNWISQTGLSTCASDVVTDLSGAARRLSKRILSLMLLLAQPSHLTKHHFHLDYTPAVGCGKAFPLCNLIAKRVTLRKARTTQCLSPLMSARAPPAKPTARAAIATGGLVHQIASKGDDQKILKMKGEARKRTSTTESLQQGGYARHAGTMSTIDAGSATCRRQHRRHYPLMRGN